MDEIKCLAVLFSCPAAGSHDIYCSICLFGDKNPSKNFFNIRGILLKFCVFIGKGINKNSI